MDHPFTPEMFQRMDESDDPLFYAFPRKVVHIDEPAIAAVGQFLAATFAPHGVLLDLMSSWRSHLPPGFVKQRLVGLGLNAEEMADNPDLDEYVVHDLNADPRLPFAADYFDGAVVTVSIQYLTQPLAVFAEVRRVRKPEWRTPFAIPDGVPAADYGAGAVATRPEGSCRRGRGGHGPACRTSGSSGGRVPLCTHQ